MHNLATTWPQPGHNPASIADPTRALPRPDPHPRIPRCMRHSVERETGIEPASLAWKAKVLPLNYSRLDGPPGRAAPAWPLHSTAAAPGDRAHRLTAWLDRSLGGGGWIRTSVGVSQQIYSLPPLATRAPLQRAGKYSTRHCSAIPARQPGRPAAALRDATSRRGRRSAGSDCRPT